MKCGNVHTLGRYPIDECLGVLKRLGFNGVEVCLENPDLAPATLTDELARHVCGRLDELQLPRSRPTWTWAMSFCATPIPWPQLPAWKARSHTAISKTWAQTCIAICSHGKATWIWPDTSEHSGESDSTGRWPWISTMKTSQLR